MTGARHLVLIVKSTGIIETPSILVNDRPLPDIYKVEDLIDIYT